VDGSEFSKMAFRRVFQRFGHSARATVLALSLCAAPGFAVAEDTELGRDLFQFISDNNPTYTEAVLWSVFWGKVCAENSGFVGEEERGEALEATREWWEGFDENALTDIVERARGTPFFDAAEQSLDVVLALRDHTKDLFLWREAHLTGDVACVDQESYAGEGDFIYDLSRLGLYRVRIEALMTERCGARWDEFCEEGGNFTVSYLLLSHQIAVYCSLLEGSGTEYPACPSLLRHDPSKRAALVRYGEALEDMGEYLVEELILVSEEIGEQSCDEITCDPEIDSFVRWASSAILLGAHDREIAELFLKVDFKLDGEGEAQTEARSNRIGLSARPYHVVWNMDGPDRRLEVIQEFSRQ
jgi:hypothetical protein